jgi:hypothetical protein
MMIVLIAQLHLHTGREKGGSMKRTRSWVPLLLSVIVSSVYGAPEVAGQRFSDWSTPANLGPTVNSSAFDG